MGKPQAGRHGEWRTRARRVSLAAAAAGLLAALAVPSAPTALAGRASASVVPGGSASRPGLWLAQAQPGLRSAVLRTLRSHSPGANVPGIVPGPISDLLGWSLALSGRTALVGAVGVNKIAGVAYVYVRTGKAWKLQAILADPRNTPEDYFGDSVALSGSTALISSTGSNGFSGIVYVYGRT